MTRAPFTSAFTRQGRRAWLLWLALLLPLAATAALLHGYGHLPTALVGDGPRASAAAGAHDQGAHATQSCDLCLSAAASLLGAPPGPVDAGHLASLGEAVGTAPAQASPGRPDGPHYAARAPPLS
jgi:hypothetical protein